MEWLMFCCWQKKGTVVEHANDGTDFACSIGDFVLACKPYMAKEEEGGGDDGPSLDLQSLSAAYRRGYPVSSVIKKVYSRIQQYDDPAV